ncbi:MAG TPA: methyltransferase domain-containing protein [Pyrinomonadaceae bacterium]|nr:methyltransferase domain-containing protein [Pyrinomonadaceae bacterium]
MFEKFKQRSYELEHLDKGDYTPEEYESCIIELQRVNQWLGDASALRNSLLKDIEAAGLQSFSVLDVGAGSGELMRVASRWARETKRDARLVGLELNERSAKAILDEGESVRSVRADAFKLPFESQQFEYVFCSLFTHHFRDPQVVELLREMSRVARRKVFVIDLHRDAVAYFFYTTVARLFLHNRLIREDGALSILRSFKTEELESLGKQAGLRNVSVEKHFPARLVLSGEPALIS